MSILLKNAKIFDGRSLGSECEDILVKDGVIARRGSGLPEDGAEVYDLGGKLLCRRHSADRADGTCQRGEHHGSCDRACRADIGEEAGVAAQRRA